MAIACPINRDFARLRDEVGETYSRLVKEPEGDFHFHHRGGFSGGGPCSRDHRTRRQERRRHGCPRGDGRCSAVLDPETAET